MCKVQTRAVRFVAAMLVWALGASAHGEYFITALSDGMSDITTLPGNAFTLDIVVTSDAADTHLFSQFRVVFSEGRLEYVSYEWGAGYTTGGVDDLSDPFVSDLSTVIDAGSYAPTSDVDLYFSNLTDDGAVFGIGTIVSLQLYVPLAMYEQFPGISPIEISVVPELFLDGFDVIPATAGQAFRLYLVPGPSAFGLFVFAGVIRPRRRRTAGGGSYGVAAS